MATDVNGIISAAQDTAKEMADNAADFVRKAQLAFDTRYEIYPGDVAVNFTDEDFTVGVVPQYRGQTFTEPTEPGAAPDMLTLPELGEEQAPTNTAQKPVLRAPQTPAQLAQFNAQAPSLNALSVPSAPAGLQNGFNATVPVMSEITVPGAPIVQLPEFDAVRPDTAIPEPGNLVAQFRQDFADQSGRLTRVIEGEVDAYMAKINPRFNEQMAAVEDRLAKYIQGGSALSPAVQNDIFERALDKNNQEYQRARDSAYEEGARRGFTLPSGAVFSAATQARQAAADNAARVAIEIAIKQAELEQQNLQFAVTQSTNLRQVVIQAAQSWAGQLVQINAQALQFAKGVLDAAIELYDLRIKIVQARVQIYQAEAEVYQHRLKAVLAVYDAYRAHIDGLKAQVSIDIAKVQAYEAQVSAYGALANAYKATIDGVAARAQIERLKVEVFGAEVQAYQARVQAKTAEWQGYRAQLEGEMSKVESYKAEVGAYGQEVEAYRAKIQAKATQIQAVGQANESAARAYQASVSAYNALVQGRSGAVQAEIQSFESTIKAWAAGVSAQEAAARVRVTNNSAKAQATLAEYHQNVQIAISNAEMNYKRMSDLSTVGTAGAAVFGKMASSALSGMNSLAAAIEQTSL